MTFRCQCIVCTGSGYAIDSRNTAKPNDKKAPITVYRRIRCGACNGSGTQVEDSYLDNMILYAGGTVTKKVGAYQIPNILSKETLEMEIVYNSTRFLQNIINH
uniref:Uncharacterized protein n=1 Tax=Chaetoceros debilis TaxID=122233 RepID=A0A7S3QK15_9STRA|mmetsp:Transcript_9224/g.13813  ORF Transcript_9224/g.13813 Transcript_9224/m.13813 type:complete len:103 (+) Transcript_9224:219-527(+)